MAWTRTLFLVLLLASNFAHAVVKVGYPFFNPPFVISKGEGFDIELIHLVCAKLPEGCSYFPAEYSKVLAALVEGSVDIAIGGFTMSTNGGSNFVYSTPYKISSGQFIALTSSGTKAISDIKNVKVGCITDSTFEDYLVSSYSQQMQVTPFTNLVQLINALVNGDIKAAFLDQAVTDYWIAHNYGQFSLVGKPLLTGSGYAIVAEPKNLDLIKRINKILDLIEKNGEYAKLYDAYF